MQHDHTEDEFIQHLNFLYPLSLAVPFLTLLSMSIILCIPF